MDKKLQEKCQLLVDNKLAVENEYKWQGVTTNVMVSNVYAIKNQQLIPEKLRKADRLIKYNSRLFSEYRGRVKPYLSAVLAYSENPEKLFDKIKAIYEEFNREKKVYSPYILVSATLLASMGYEADCKDLLDIIDKTKALYKLMRQNHRILTADEDIAFATLLAISGRDIVQLEKEMEKCFKKLGTLSSSKDAIQSLSHVLTLEEVDYESKCNRVFELMDGLVKKGRKYGKGYELTVIGSLALLDIETDKLVDEIIEADDYLKNAKGFKSMGLGANQRLMYAAMMVLSVHTPDRPYDKSNEDNKFYNQTTILCNIMVAGTAISN